MRSTSSNDVFTCDADRGSMYSVSVDERGEPKGVSKSDAFSLFDAPGRKARTSSTVRDTKRGNMALDFCTRCTGMGGRSMPSSSCVGDEEARELVGDQEDVDSEHAVSDSGSCSLVPMNEPALERLESDERERGGRRLVEEARARSALGRGGGLRRGGGCEADGMGII